MSQNIKSDMPEHVKSTQSKSFFKMTTNKERPLKGLGTGVKTTQNKTLHKTPRYKTNSVPTEDHDAPKAKTTNDTQANRSTSDETQTDASKTKTTNDTQANGPTSDETKTTNDTQANGSTSNETKTDAPKTKTTSDTQDNRTTPDETKSDDAPKTKTTGDTQANGTTSYDIQSSHDVSTGVSGLTEQSKPIKPQSPATPLPNHTVPSIAKRTLLTNSPTTRKFNIVEDVEFENENNITLNINTTDEEIDNMLRNIDKSITHPPSNTPDQNNSHGQTTFMNSGAHVSSSVHSILTALPASSTDFIDSLPSMFRDVRSTSSKWSKISKTEIASAVQECRTVLRKTDTDIHSLFESLSACVMAIEGTRMHETSENNTVCNVVQRIRPVIQQTQNILQRLVAHRRHMLVTLSVRVAEHCRFYESLRTKQTKHTRSEIERYTRQASEKNDLIDHETASVLEKTRPILIRVLTSINVGISDVKNRVEKCGGVIEKLNPKDFVVVQPVLAKLDTLQTIVKGFVEKNKHVGQGDPSVRYGTIASIHKNLTEWSDSLAPLKKYLSSTSNDVPTAEECKDKWETAKRLYNEAVHKKELLKASAVGNENESDGDSSLADKINGRSELDILLSGTISHDPDDTIKRLERAKELASNLMLSRCLVNYKTVVDTLNTKLDGEIKNIGKLAHIVKFHTEKHIRKRSMIGMQLEQMLHILEESVKEESEQLAIATSSAIVSTVSTTSTTLRESCREANLAVMNLVNYIRNMVIIGLPLIDSAIFGNDFVKPSTFGVMPHTQPIQHNVPAESIGNQTVIRTIFNTMQKFIHDCEMIQKHMNKYEMESWRCMYITCVQLTYC